MVILFPDPFHVHFIRLRSYDLCRYQNPLYVNQLHLSLMTFESDGSDFVIFGVSLMRSTNGEPLRDSPNDADSIVRVRISEMSVFFDFFGFVKRQSKDHSQLKLDLVVELAQWFPNFGLSHRLISSTKIGGQHQIRCENDNQNKLFRSSGGIEILQSNSSTIWIL